MLSGVDAIYWINLDRSKYRRRNMETLFENELFSELKGKNAIHRVEAIDGAGEKEPEVRERLSRYMRSLPSTAEREARGIHITYKEIACTLSHLTAIRRFAEEGQPGQFAIIMEDDITLDFQKYWHCLPFQNVREMMAMCPDPAWEIIQLSFTLDNFKTSPIQKKTSSLFVKNDATKDNGALFATTAYLLKHSFARKLTSYCYKSGSTIDVMGLLRNKDSFACDVFLYKHANTYCLTYPLFIYAFDAKSVIHSDHERHHKKNYLYCDDRWKHAMWKRKSRNGVYYFLTLGFLCIVLWCVKTDISVEANNVALLPKESNQSSAFPIVVFGMALLLVLWILREMRRNQEHVASVVKSCNIIGYFHICQDRNWERSFDLIMNTIKKSGLYDACKEIRVGIVNTSSTVIPDHRLQESKLRLVKTGFSQEYERATLLHMHESSVEDPANTVYFYVHSKGLRHFGTSREAKVIEWIQDLLHWNIVKWKDAILSLQYHDTYGCNYNNTHYAGNFWWATRNHMQSLPSHIASYYTAPEDYVTSTLYKDFPGRIGCAHNCASCYETPSYLQNFYDSDVTHPNR